MATDRSKHVKKMDPDDVLLFVRKHDDPAVTTSDVAEEFDVTTRGAHYRLSQLKERGDLRDKDVGASGKIWYAVG